MTTSVELVSLTMQIGADSICSETFHELTRFFKSLRESEAKWV